MIDSLLAHPAGRPTVPNLSSRRDGHGRSNAAPHATSLDDDRARVATGRVLTVVELQRALRAARAAVPERPTPAPTSTGTPAHRHATTVAVLAAHPGAGASTVALALADVAAAAGLRVRLVELCHPQRCGLAGAATRELGPVGDGRWRRATRGQVVIDRPCAAVSLADVPAAEPDGLRLLDLSVVDPATAPEDSFLVLVCRASLPGVRAADTTLAGVPADALVVIGPRRWPGPVTAAAGPCVRRLREKGCLINLPIDRHLQVTGPTGDPLPRAVLTAARRLLALTQDPAVRERPRR